MREGYVGLSTCGPFSAEYRGVAWNAQGFFACKAFQHEAKRRFVKKLLTKADFVLISESHGTKGGQRAFTDIEGTKAFWSEGTASRGGVGILVKQDFLDKFGEQQPVWKEPCKGRLGCLELRGEKGAMFIWSAYFPTGCSRPIGEDQGGPAIPEQESLGLQRRHLAQMIRDGLRNREALSVVGGDFNFVMNKEDRFSKSTGEFSGGSDCREAEAWRHMFGPDSGLYEQMQMDATHHGPVSRGRLDRVYVTHSVADQLDHLMFATTLEWTPRLSHHRPLAFGKLKRQKKGDTKRTPSREDETQSVSCGQPHPVVFVLAWKCNSQIYMT